MSEDLASHPLSQLDRERLHWTIKVGGETHLLDLLPDALRSGTSVAVDGRTVLRMRKPSEARPRVERSVVINAQQVLIALQWNGAIMGTNVYVDGLSLLDGRSVEMDRIAAPQPTHGYELWFRPPVRGPIDPPLMSPWLATLAITSVVALVVTPVPFIVPRLVAVAYLSGLWFWVWYVVTARTNAYLLHRRELGDARRVVAFGAVFLGYPLICVLIVAGISLLAGR